MTEPKATNISPYGGVDDNTAASPPVFGESPPTNDSAGGFLEVGPQDRRGSAEWDASKVPPSRFQKRKGSIYSTPGSRDGQVDSNYAAKFHAKHAEKGYNKK